MIQKKVLSIFEDHWQRIACPFCQHVVSFKIITGTVEVKGDTCSHYEGWEVKGSQPLIWFDDRVDKTRTEKEEHIRQGFRYYIRSSGYRIENCSSHGEMFEKDCMECRADLEVSNFHKTQFMKRTDDTLMAGYMQPELIFCPLGHVMATANKGSVDKMVAECWTENCLYYKQTYEVILPVIGLKKV